jgi:hypothetical protein
MEIIRSEFAGRVKQVGSKRVDLHVDVELKWDGEHDPLAVEVTFVVQGDEESSTWYLARDLLYRGLNSFTPVGSGDARLRYEGVSTGTVLLCLKAPLDGVESHADVALPHGEVYSFLMKTFKVTPIGGEKLDAELDEFLADVFRKDAA